MEASVNLHASSLIDWTRCEQGTLWATTHPESSEPQAEHVAGWIGSCVHAWAADLYGDIPAPPDPMRFDRITPTLDIAYRQIDRMGKRIAHYVRDQGWDIRRHELSVEGGVDGIPHWLNILGTLDLEVWTAIELWILDLKTGAFPRGVWLQLGTYGALHERLVNRLGCLHFPRVRIDEDLPEPVLEVRPAGPVIEAAVAVIQRVGRLIAKPEAAIPAPGGWCQFCNHPTCAVRVAGEIEEPA